MAYQNGVKTNKPLFIMASVRTKQARNEILKSECKTEESLNAGLGFRTFMYCDLWSYVLRPLDFQFQKRIIF